MRVLEEEEARRLCSELFLSVTRHVCTCVDLCVCARRDCFRGFNLRVFLNLEFLVLSLLKASGCTFKQQKPLNNQAIHLIHGKSMLSVFGACQMCVFFFFFLSRKVFPRVTAS